MPSKTLRHRWPYLAATAAIAMAAITATGVPGAQAAPLSCLPGYLCLVEPTGNVVLVPSGATEPFNPGVPVIEIANKATTAYCDEFRNSDGSIQFSDIPLGSDKIYSPPITVLWVSAITTGQACPL